MFDYQLFGHYVRTIPFNHPIWVKEVLRILRHSGSTSFFFKIHQHGSEYLECIQGSLLSLLSSLLVFSWVLRHRGNRTEVTYIFLPGRASPGFLEAQEKLNMTTIFQEEEGNVRTVPRIASCGVSLYSPCDELAKYHPCLDRSK